MFRPACRASRRVSGGTPHTRAARLVRRWISSPNGSTKGSPVTAHLRRIVPLAVALSSLVGTQAVAVAQADVPAAHTAKAKHHHRHHHRHHHSRIPQHNGG